MKSQIRFFRQALRISQLAQQCGIRRFAVSGTDAPLQSKPTTVASTMTRIKKNFSSRR